MDPVGGERMASTMTTNNFYLKHPNSDEMSEFTEFTAFENWMHIRITHFVHWGKARSDADSKVVEIDEAREVWRKLVGHGYARDKGDDRLRDLAMKHRTRCESNKNLKKHKNRQLEIGQK